MAFVLEVAGDNFKAAAAAAKVDPRSTFDPLRAAAQAFEGLFNDQKNLVPIWNKPDDHAQNFRGLGLRCSQALRGTK